MATLVPRVYVYVTRQTAAQSRYAGPCRDAEQHIYSRTSDRPLLQLQSLHWLPIRERISHKVVTLAFKARRMSSLPYLNSLLNDHVSSLSDLPARRV